LPKFKGSPVFSFGDISKEKNRKKQVSEFIGGIEGADGKHTYIAHRHGYMSVKHLRLGLIVR
jgi:hypothetical protein